MNSDLNVALEMIELMKRDAFDNSKSEEELDEKLNTLEDIRIEIIKGNTDLMHKVINNYNK